MSSNLRIPKICQDCGSDFIAKTTVTQYCSDRCAKRAYKKRKRKQKVEAVPTLSQQKVNHSKEIVGDKEFLSIKETCQLLGTSRMTIYRQIKSGTIPAAKVGARTIIKRTDIEKLFTA
ncbi:helix-turn-helix domain-containing protein [Acidiluteibacter ferrifornacis]|uniref:Helix-turn-helix domain-containing protein n=1 Tax=Acidiluteibacter ferrifornacis TaxID=2692424 RepID=A0A6N9NKL1_9FLAO|nr:helix-turn-helix domain-containing protein [Acidiluteibacter ferrifornacis]NBG66402.1 helix-turn-helix domain-containing protein [Acidiluteibacter ferrifornacis]